MFERLKQQIGCELFQQIQMKTVVIVGLGGVGGHAAEAIARSAFQQIILMDPDKVDASNLNRQVVALHSTIGRYKVDVMKDRILDINPDCQVITLAKSYNEETKEWLFMHEIDYVIDAIDNVKDKVDLIEETMKRKIKLISVMGTGRKFYPEQLEIIPLSKTSYDPLARTLRQKLRKTLDIRKIKVVSSKEPPKPLDPDNPAPCTNAFVPATAGLLAGNFVFLDAIGRSV